MYLSLKNRGNQKLKTHVWMQKWNYHYGICLGQPCHIACYVFPLSGIWANPWLSCFQNKVRKLQNSWMTISLKRLSNQNNVVPFMRRLKLATHYKIAYERRQTELFATITFSRNEMKSCDNELVFTAPNLSDLNLVTLATHVSSIRFSASALKPAWSIAQYVTWIGWFTVQIDKSFHVF